MSVLGLELALGRVMAWVWALVRELVSAWGLAVGSLVLGLVSA